MTQRQDERAALLRELDHSGLSMVEFCRRRRLVYGTVAGWRSMARREAGPFVEVETVAANETGDGSRNNGGALCAELLLPGGAVLRIYQAADKGGAV